MTSGRADPLARRGLRAQGGLQGQKDQPVRRDPEVQAFPLRLVLRQDQQDRRDRRCRPRRPRRPS
jgi:hypothetical protein